MVSYFKCCHSTKYGKVPFTLVKGFHANNNENVCAIYMTYDASALKIYYNRWNFCQSASQLQ